ncbi:MAG TPA: hypothetical protein VL125_11985 [Pelobium sp.]|nr:hypothetical protein [Pelobium sp.]
MYLNNYQSFIFGAVILGILSFIACEKTIETSKIVGFGVNVELAPSESVWFGSDTLSGVYTKVDNIEDSRCPEGAVCVWAGEAKTSLLVVQKQDSVNLNLKLNSPTDSVSFSLNNKSYKAVLTAVNPYPNLKNNTSAKSATLTILITN